MVDRPGIRRDAGAVKRQRQRRNIRFWRLCLKFPPASLSLRYGPLMTFQEKVVDHIRLDFGEQL